MQLLTWNEDKIPITPGFITSGTLAAAILYMYIMLKAALQYIAHLFFYFGAASKLSGLWQFQILCDHLYKGKSKSFQKC